MQKCKLIFIISFLFLVTGCTPFIAERVPLSFERPKECQAFLSTLDERVEQAGVRDAASYPVPGFPYLRTNRFFSFLKGNINDQESREQWSRWMQKLDLEARKKEISNLPEDIVSSFSSEQGTPSSREQLYEQVTSCSDRLFQHDKTRPDFYETLIPLVAVPDEYSLTMRILGLYPLMAIPVAITTDSSRKKIRSWYDTNLENLPVDGTTPGIYPC